MNIKGLNRVSLNVIKLNVVGVVNSAIHWLHYLTSDGRHYVTADKEYYKCKE